MGLSRTHTRTLLYTAGSEPYRRLESCLQSQMWVSRCDLNQVTHYPFEVLIFVMFPREKQYHTVMPFDPLRALSLIARQFGVTRARGSGLSRWRKRVLADMKPLGQTVAVQRIRSINRIKRADFDAPDFLPGLGQEVPPYISRS